MKFNMKKMVIGTLTLATTVILGACSGTTGEEQLVIYTNADEEAVNAMEESLTENGLEGQYVIQTFGTAELGGRLLAEGADIEADLVTMSAYYLDTAQEQNDMFLEFEPSVTRMDEVEQTFHYPITVQEGALFYNTKLLEENNLQSPESYKDLADAAYAENISIPDINHSSTAWLMMQGLVDNYGEDKAVDILTDIYKNAGDHITDSGSGPLNGVRGGEVPIGSGLRHQAIRYKNDGEPIEYVDPVEGTYLLTEDLAIINKGEDTKEELATQAADIILTDGRERIMEFYPVSVYEGEETSSEYAAENYKRFPEALTTELLQKHTELSNQAKENAGIQ